MSVKAKTSLFRDMLYFKEVVCERQISAAASKNGIKPSNLSKIIQGFEQMASKKLFLRTSRGLEPTSEALKIAEFIISVEKHFDSCAMKMTKRNTPGILNLYLPQNIKLPHLNLFCKDNPGLTLVMCNAPHEADVWVDYAEPIEINDWVCTKNQIGTNLNQTIWVGSINEKLPLALAKFIISEMHHQ